MKKILNLLFVMVLLVSTFNLPVLAKSNSDVEVLNLAPFVDFEVTEKKKVDVIVDIGNIDYTPNQINSYINTTLRPQLAAKGLDYNIIVKDTSEGIDHFYFFYEREHTSKNIAEYTYYKYSLNNGLEEVVLNDSDLTWKKNIMQRSEQSFYDPNKQVLIRNDRIINLKTKTSVNRRYAANTLNKVFYFADGSVVTIENGSQSLTAQAVKLQENNGVFSYAPLSTTSSRLRYNDTSGYERFYVTPTQDIAYIFERTQGFYNGVHTYGDSKVYFLKKTNSYSTLITGNTRLYPKGNINFLDERTWFVEKAVQYGNMYPGQVNPEAIYSVNALYDTSNTNSNTSLTNPTPYDHIDRTRYTYEEKLYKWEYDNENQVYVSVKNDGIHLAYGFGNPYAIIPYPFTPSRNNNIQYIIELGRFGSHIVLMETQQDADMYIFNTETLQFTNIGRFYGSVLPNNSSIASFRIEFYNFPVDYKAKTYLVKDVINEQHHRYDAEVYYVRLDDQISEQFGSTRQSVEIANLLSENNMTFIGVGSSTAKPYHDNMLKMVDYNGKTFLNTNIEQAFLSVTDFIVNKKEVDLHVLQATSTPITTSQIQSITNQVRNDLRASNFVITVHNVHATPNNLYNLIQEVKWNDYKNNYIFSLDSSTLSILDIEEYVSIIASNMNAHYAHFASYGTSTNKSKRQTILSHMDNNGYVSQLTNTTSIANELKTYIINTAESNPKRHISKLVLKHNPDTNEYSSEISLNAYYYDTEGDREKAERFKTEHDPTVYENHTGLMPNTGTYLNSAITRFTKVGKYEIVAQKQDTPTNNKAAFTNYDLWSDDSLSRLVLYVHRQPVAEFQAYFNSSNQFVLNDLSYDLDYYSTYSKGILKWNWKYKKTTDAEWTIGKPSNLNATNEYIIALKVQDIDEAWSNEYMQVVGKNLPPIAYFEVVPSQSSWTKNPVITDKSFSPSGLSITNRQWKVYREGKLLINSTTQPTAASIKNAANSQFTNALGVYTIELVVRDSAGNQSQPYETTLELINYAPIPLFEIEQPIYRDTLLNITNLTGDKDLDDETVTFNWTFKKDTRSFTKTGKQPSFTIKSLGLGKQAVGKWEVTLSAKDTLQTEGKLTKLFNVLNHAPTSSITGEEIAYLDDVKTYLGDPKDNDSEDVASLKSYWKVTTPSGQVKAEYTKDISVTFTQKGKYKLEHWVVDQLGDSSPVYTKMVTVPNQPPIAGFTMSPNPTYRDTVVDFKSLAYDVDGYIVSHKYMAENTADVVSLLSTEEDFKRAFQSVGPVKITQIVVDDDGESSSVTKTIIVNNRPPQLTMLYPNSKSATSPTVISHTSPQFNWLYTDLDLDIQQRAELVISVNKNGKEEQVLNLTKQGSQTFINTSQLPLQEGELYSVKGRAYDGYEWGAWSDPVYFRLQLNEPPIANFISSPKRVYEGDTLTIEHRLEDRDFDDLFVRYTVVEENGRKLYFPSEQSYYVVDKVNYNSFAYTYKSLSAQTVTIKQTVTDGKSEPIEKRETVTFHPLTISADVYHTELWEMYRQQYNEKNSKQWSKHQFYAGEKFMLTALTTMFDYERTDTVLYAERVDMYFPKLKATVTLTAQGSEGQFNGEYYEQALNKLGNGIYELQFKVYYSNGVIKQDNVLIEIIGEAISFIGVHRMK